MRRIVIIGTGAVGSAIAWTLAVRECAEELILIDQIHPLAEGEAMDMQNVLPLIDNVTIRIGDYADCAEADCIIITAGRSRHEGESRNDLLEGNRSIMLNILDKLSPYYKGCYLIIVSNPVDALTYLAINYFKDYSSKIVGTGTLLDSARLRMILVQYLHISAKDINAYVIGEHGENQMPLWSMTKVRDIPIDKYCETYGIPWDTEVKSNLAQQIRSMGREIIGKKGRTQYGISACIAYLIEYLDKDEGGLICLAHTFGSFCKEKMAVSLPILMASNGIKLFPFSFGNQELEWQEVISALQKRKDDGG